MGVYLCVRPRLGERLLRGALAQRGRLVRGHRLVACTHGGTVRGCRLGGGGTLDGAFASQRALLRRVYNGGGSEVGARQLGGMRVVAVSGRTNKGGKQDEIITIQ